MNFSWVEKYRPRKIDECILPETTKNTFNEFLNTGQIPNLLLFGTAGIGKTTVAKALCEQLGADYIVINGSDEGRAIDTIRNKCKNFASTLSLSSDSKHKVVIVDEFSTTQPAMYNSLYGQTLRRFMVTVGLFFTCNYNKIIDPLHSRAPGRFLHPRRKKRNFLQEPSSTVSGLYLRKKAYSMIKRFFHKSSLSSSLTGVLHLTSVNDMQLVELTAAFFLVCLMSNSSNLSDALKNKQYTTVKKWVSNNLDNEPSHIFSSIYDNLYQNWKQELFLKRF